MRVASKRVRARPVRNVILLSVIGLCPGANANVGPWCCEQPQASVDGHNVVITFSVVDRRGCLSASAGRILRSMRTSGPKLSSNSDGNPQFRFGWLQSPYGS